MAVRKKFEGPCRRRVASAPPIELGSGAYQAGILCEFLQDHGLNLREGVARGLFWCRGKCRRGIVQHTERHPRGVRCVSAPRTGVARRLP